MMRLEDWMWFSEQNKLYGYIFGHPVIEDGSTIWTENVVPDFDKKVATSARNTYELGKEYNAELERLEWPT